MTFWQRHRRAICLIGAVVVILLVYRAMGQSATTQPARWCTGVTCYSTNILYRSWSDGTIDRYTPGGMFGPGGWSTLP